MFTKTFAMAMLHSRSTSLFIFVAYADQIACIRRNTTYVKTSHISISLTGECDAASCKAFDRLFTLPSGKSAGRE